MTRDAEKTTPFVKEDKPPSRGTKGSEKPDPSAKAVPALGHMFSNFEASKNRKLPRWAAPLLTAMLLVHVVIFLTMWVKTIWDIEQLERRHRRRRRRPRAASSPRTSSSRRRR